MPVHFPATTDIVGIEPIAAERDLKIVGKKLKTVYEKVLKD